MSRALNDSGVPWIGRIPEGWSVEPFRRHFRESKELNGSAPVGPMLSISGYRGVEEKVYESASLVRDDSQLETYRVVRPGQLAVNTMWLNYAGLGVSELTGHMSPAYRAYWISDRLDRRYAHHLLRSSVYVQGYTALLTGIRPNSLQMSRADLMAFPVLLPPLEEQRAIAVYLDRETGQIDAFIAKNEELIALLKERRAAAIELAVAPRELPSTWDTCQVRRLGPKNESGVSVNGYSVPAEGEEIGVLKTGAVSKGYFDPNENKRVVEEDLARVAAPVRGGTLIVNRANTPELVGRAGYVPDDYPTLFLSDKLWQLTFELADPAYMHFWTLSTAYRSQLGGLSVGASSSMQNLSYGDFLSVTISIPPLPEQREIVSRLNRVTDEIDAAAEVARRGVSLARERRAALISAAVTGKIDVGVAT